jgi:hypothetical protein
MPAKILPPKLQKDGSHDLRAELLDYEKYSPIAFYQSLPMMDDVFDEKLQRLTFFLGFTKTLSICNLRYEF